MSSSTSRKILEQQSTFTRQATILRKNLTEWDRILHDPRRGEDWPTMLGRLNASWNQTINLDKCIEDVLEHFVYVPKQSTANAQDIPFFLSTRLETPQHHLPKGTTTVTGGGGDHHQQDPSGGEDPFRELASPAGDPVQQLVTFESAATQLASEYEETMVRF